MTNKKITSRVITLLSGIIIAMVMIILPGGYFLNDYYHERGSLKTEVDIYGHLLTKFISSNPDTWEFEQARLEEFVLHGPIEEHPETTIILNLKNEVVAQKTHNLPSPVIMTSAELMDSGTVAGRLEVYHSIQPIIVKTGELFLLLLPFGVVTFILLYNIPIRALRRTELELYDTNERLQVLNSGLEASNKEREGLILELRESFAKIKTLKGFIPICSSCKKIRDDKGFWEQVEAYVSKHTDAQFSHSICPECTKKLYPEYYDEIWGKKEKAD